MIILAGTSKGLVVYSRQPDGWKVAGVHFRGMPVSMIYVDDRTHTWWVGLSHRHWGQKLHFTNDEGANWQAVTTPQFSAGLEQNPGRPAVLKKIWCMKQSGTDRPGELWLGVEPGALFYSRDSGQHFSLVEGLWNHPSRKDKSQWFGAGRDEPFIHSIVVDPRNSDHVYIAVSCAGIFETTDGGKNWQPKNDGLIAAYLPDPQVEIGHDPHRLFCCHSNPDVLWQQNHCGIFRSTNGGEYWENVTDPNGLADYGFALAIDHEDPLKAWVIPAVSDEERVAPDLSLCVCHTKDGGKSWSAQRNGLPQDNCFDIVFRHSLVRKNNVLAFGTTTGNMYLSDNDGETWICISNNLARIDYLAIA